MNTQTTQTTKNNAMMLDLALGNGGKANKAVRTVAVELVAAVFTGTVTVALVVKAQAVETKNSSAEVVSAFQTLVASMK